jgi:hypothetical protein
MNTQLVVRSKDNNLVVKGRSVDPDQNVYIIDFIWIIS